MFESRQLQGVEVVLMGNENKPGYNKNQTNEAIAAIFEGSAGFTGDGNWEPSRVEGGRKEEERRIKDRAAIRSVGRAVKSDVEESRRVRSVGKIGHPS